MSIDFGKRRIANTMLIVVLAGAMFSVSGSMRRLFAAQLTPQELVRDAIENFQNLHSCQYRIILHLTKGEMVQESEYVFYYQKPNLVRMYVKKGKDRGSTVLMRKDGVIRGKRGGLLSVIPVTLKPDDERLSDLWGNKFYESDWGTLLKETGARMEEGVPCRVEEIEGGKQVLLTIEGKNGYVERNWLESGRLVLVKRQIRKANGDSLDATWTDVVLNPEFKEGFFDF
jgi:outer membrane lipoprotein-sorting protein